MQTRSLLLTNRLFDALTVSVACGVVALGSPAMIRASDVAAARSNKCPARGSHVLLAVGRARVFRLRRSDYYACLKGGHTVLLGTSTRPGDYNDAILYVSHFRLSGVSVAWALDIPQDPSGDSIFVIYVVNLKTGAQVHVLQTGNVPAYDHPSSADYGLGPTKALVLTRGGSVAWIAQRNLPGPPYYELWRSDTRGTTMLDSGGDIAPTSLTLDGHRVQWARGGQSFSTGIS